MNKKKKSTNTKDGLAIQKERKDKEDGPCVLSIRIHSVLQQTERMLAKQAYSRGFWVDRVSSANSAPQTCFKESCHLRRAFDVVIDHAAVREKKGMQWRFSIHSWIRRNR